MFRLDEPAEFIGAWWLSTRPDDQQKGILTYSPGEGLRLSLIGHFPDGLYREKPHRTHEDSRNDDPWRVIHGAVDGKAITLLECIPTHTSERFGADVPSPAHQTIRARTALIGIHIPDAEEPIFSALEVCIENYGRWLGEVNVDSCTNMDAHGRSTSGKIEINPHKPKTLQLHEAKIESLHRVETQIRYWTKSGLEAMASDTPSLMITPETPRSLARIIREVRVIESLMTFASLRPSSAIWLRAQIDEAAPPIFNQPYPLERVKILYLPRSLTDRHEPTSRSKEFLFRCSDIPFDEAIPNWFRLQNRHKSTIARLTALIYFPKRFVEDLVLEAVEIAEAFHRQLGIDKPPFNKKEFDKYRKQVLAGLPLKYQERFKQELRNQLSLRDRLTHLAEQLDPEVASALLPSIEEWAQNATRARNHLTHTGEAPNRSLEMLDAIAGVTRAVVILILLQKMGLSKEGQLSLLQSGSPLGMEAKNARHFLSPPTTSGSP